MTPHRRTGERETIAERRLRAFELRKAGNSYRAIARVLGVNEATAYKDVMGRLREISALEETEREDVRRLELERLDALFHAHYEKAATGDTKDTLCVLRIMEHRADLLGLAAATKLADPQGQPLQFTLVIEKPDASAVTAPDQPTGSYLR
jgi:hypothetical protein